MAGTGTDRLAATEAISRLAGVLTDLGDALAQADLDGVLAQQPRLEELTRQLQAMDGPLDRDTLAPAVLAAQLALQRARRLGDGLTQFAEAARVARGLVAPYDRDGRPADPALSGSFDARG
ncbi:MAG TPA: hypothetical protein VIL25_07360 [Vicinamibacterales bacterium]